MLVQEYDAPRARLREEACYRREEAQCRRAEPEALRRRLEPRRRASPEEAARRPPEQDPRERQVQRGKNGDGDRDYAALPKQLEEQFEVLYPDAALRPTKIRVGDPWTRVRKKNLLSEPQPL